MAVKLLNHAEDTLNRLMDEVKDINTELAEALDNAVKKELDQAYARIAEALHKVKHIKDFGPSDE